MLAKRTPCEGIMIGQVVAYKVLQESSRLATLYVFLFDALRLVAAKSHVLDDVLAPRFARDTHKILRIRVDVEST